jgi:hypothetical protein
VQNFWLSGLLFARTQFHLVSLTGWLAG